MEEIFDIVSDVEFIRNKIRALESPIIQFLQQSTECCLFIRRYARHGFISKCCLQVQLVFSCTEQLRTGRMLDVGSDEKIDGFMARFRDLKGALDTGIALQTSFVSVRMSEKVDMMCT